MALADGRIVIVATADVFEGGKWKTLLIYRDSEGLALERIHRESGKRDRFRLTREELAGLAAAAELLLSTLSNATAPSAGGSTDSPPASRASRGPDNSRSSPRQGSIV
jgi:hypothetical protein